jgi:carbon-monoxide dehydrogenase iron sulfur subunit
MAFGDDMLSPQLRAPQADAKGEKGHVATETHQRAGVVRHKKELCRGCRICELVCSAVHDGVCSAHLSRIHINADDFTFSYPAVVCTQCREAACYHACPHTDEALCIDAETGARYIDESACDGCGECAAACPLPVAPIWRRDESDPTTYFKCDLCRGVEEGPQCVRLCPWGALTYREPVT